MQNEAAPGSDTLPLIIMTHETTQGAIAKACDQIAALDCVVGKPVQMWVRN